MAWSKLGIKINSCRAITGWVLANLRSAVCTGGEILKIQFPPKILYKKVYPINLAYNKKAAG